MVINNKKKMTVFWILTIDAMMVSLLQTALNTALAPIMEEMHISAATVQWLSSAYSLVLGIVILATAFLFRRFKTKPLALFAIAITVVGCVISALAGNFPVLLTGRLFQAAGGGIIMNMVSVVILSIFPNEKKGTMMGIFSLATCVGPVLAPVVGGIVVDYFGWKILFWIFTVVFVLILVAAFLGMESVLENEYVKLDWGSMLLCSIGFCGLILGIGNLGMQSIRNMNFWIPVIVGAVSIVLFCIRQLNMTDPFMNLRVFKNRVFLLGTVNAVLMMLVMMALVTMIPLCSQSVLGFTATQSGLIILPGSLIMGAINMVSGKVYDTLGMKKLLPLGGILSIIGVVASLFMNGFSGVMDVMVIYAMTLIGPGVLSSTVMTWSISTLKLNQISQASALFTSIRTIAGAFGSAIFVGIMTSSADRIGSLESGMRYSFLLMLIPVIVQFVFCLSGMKECRTLPA